VFPVRYEHHPHIKIKAIPVTSRVSLQGCDMLRVSHCIDNRLTDADEVVNLTRRLRSAPQNNFYFCLWY
jgi:hypothetical protein